MTPVSGLSLDALQPNSVVVVLPMIAAPCAFTRSEAGASSGRDEIGERARAGGEAHALDGGEVLDRERQPGQHAAVLARHDRALGVARGLHREVGA